MGQGSNGTDAPRTNDEVIEAFRAHNGQVGGIFTGADLVLLTTHGARTGRPRTTPVAAMHQPDGIVVFATNAGSQRDPAWLFNLRAHPIVELEAPGSDGVVERFGAHAVEVASADAIRLFDLQVRADPAFAAYRERISRPIPAVMLRRTEVPTEPALLDDSTRS
ncbi:nitroreductase/quinone reductase family protein [Agromyces albus]|uniref:nitroreductase/quinone reductase family protein n=1 Tax=Agromyces albus TaxID=205332 RepID=UPI00278980BC|nr:nitroreductase/quinone reductase family protein [Agromyces albus]MDQ0576672.1 deazaflavin-dependent oxidoreductase (nitroreductase family) [Agromyces albus]